MRMLVSDMAGRASVEIKGRQLGYDLSETRARPAGWSERVKDLEARGYTFEAADASFELLLRDELAGERLRHFQVESWRVIVERRADGAVVSEATVKLNAKGERIVATGEGNGPVNALDNALRLALERLYPELAMLELADYKVRILENSHGTGAVTRVLIESRDGTGAAGRHLEHGRGGREHHRRVLARAGGGRHLRPAARGLSADRTKRGGLSPAPVSPAPPGQSVHPRPRGSPFTRAPGQSVRLRPGGGLFRCGRRQPFPSRRRGYVGKAQWFTVFPAMNRRLDMPDGRQGAAMRRIGAGTWTGAACLCAAVALTAGAGPAGAAVLGGPAGTGAAGCGPAQLRAGVPEQIPGDPQRGMDKQSWNIVLRNTGTVSCSLRGWPAITARACNGRAVPLAVRDAAVSNLAAVPERQVILAPGDSAVVTAMSADEQPRCTTSWTLAVRLPGAGSGREGVLLGRRGPCRAAGDHGLPAGQQPAGGPDAAPRHVGVGRGGRGRHRDLPAADRRGTLPRAAGPRPPACGSP